MADQQYASTSGVVQQFKDKPVTTQREVSEQTVNEFTIRSFSSGKLVRVTLWPEFGPATVKKIVKGAAVSVDGPFNVSEGKDGKTYFNMTAREITITTPEPKSDREVVNQKNDAGSDDGAPF